MVDAVPALEPPLAIAYGRCLLLLHLLRYRVLMLLAECISSKFGYVQLDSCGFRAKLGEALKDSPISAKLISSDSIPTWTLQEILNFVSTVPPSFLPKLESVSSIAASIVECENGVDGDIADGSIEERSERLSRRLERLRQICHELGVDRDLVDHATTLIYLSPGPIPRGSDSFDQLQKADEILEVSTGAAIFPAFQTYLSLYLHPVVEVRYAASLGAAASLRYMHEPSSPQDREASARLALEEAIIASDMYPAGSGALSELGDALYQLEYRRAEAVKYRRRAQLLADLPPSPPVPIETVLPRPLEWQRMLASLRLYTLEKAIRSHVPFKLNFDKLHPRVSLPPHLLRVKPGTSPSLDPILFLAGYVVSTPIIDELAISIRLAHPDFRTYYRIRIHLEKLSHGQELLEMLPLFSYVVASGLTSEPGSNAYSGTIHSIWVSLACWFCGKLEPVVCSDCSFACYCSDSCKGADHHAASCKIIQRHVAQSEGLQMPRDAARAGHASNLKRANTWFPIHTIPPPSVRQLEQFLQSNIGPLFAIRLMLELNIVKDNRFFLILDGTKEILRVSPGTDVLRMVSMATEKHKLDSSQKQQAVEYLSTLLGSPSKLVILFIGKGNAHNLSVIDISTCSESIRNTVVNFERISRYCSLQTFEDALAYMKRLAHSQVLEIGVQWFFIYTRPSANLDAALSGTDASKWIMTLSLDTAISTAVVKQSWVDRIIEMAESDGFFEDAIKAKLKKPFLSVGPFEKWIIITGPIELQVDACGFFAVENFEEVPKELEWLHHLPELAERELEVVWFSYFFITQEQRRQRFGARFLGLLEATEMEGLRIRRLRQDPHSQPRTAVFIVHTSTSGAFSFAHTFWEQMGYNRTREDDEENSGQRTYIRIVYPTIWDCNAPPSQ